MFNQLLKCEAIQNFDEYSLNELRKLRQDIHTEQNKYFEKKSVKSFNDLSAQEKKEALCRYKVMKERLLYNIRKKEGAYNLYDIETPANRSMINTFNTYINALLKYNLPIRIELDVKTNNRINNIVDWYTNTDDFAKRLKDILDRNSEKVLLEIRLTVRAMDNGTCVDGFYRIFRKEISQEKLYANRNIQSIERKHKKTINSNKKKPIKKNSNYVIYF